MTEEDNLYAIEVDSDCISQDFDDYDLYGERMTPDSPESDIEFE